MPVGSKRRAIAAWAISCAAMYVVANLVALFPNVGPYFEVIGFQSYVLASEGWYILASGAALPIWLPFARHRKLARPVADMVIFAVSSILPILCIFFLFVLDGRSDVFQLTTYSDLRFPGGMSSAQAQLSVAQLAMLYGLAAGLLYWLLAGRPRPPYASGHPPVGQSRDE